MIAIYHISCGAWVPCHRRSPTLTMTSVLSGTNHSSCRCASRPAPQLLPQLLPKLEAVLRDELELRPPHPPPLPRLPPTPPSLPTEVCAFSTQHFYAQRTVVRQEPCGFTRDECCYHARMASPDANAFELSDTGCCLLVYREPGGTLVQDTTRWGYLSADAGTGLA